MRRAGAAVALLIAGCGGGDAARTVAAPPPDRAVPPRPRAAGPSLTEPAPRWVQRFCAEVVRRSALACPAEVPSGSQAPALAPERPTPRGYRLVADSWSVAGRRTSRDDRPLAAAKPRGGVLRWTTAGGRYTVRAEGRARLRRVARSFGR